MENETYKPSEKYIARRIHWHDQHEPAAVSEAFIALHACVERLRETLTEEQRLLPCKCEDAYFLADGETVWHYFSAGFKEGLRLLSRFRKG